MKSILLLAFVIVSTLTATSQVSNEEFELYRKLQQQKADTIINNGDGKVVIIDKRPRTINVPQTRQIRDNQPIIINIPENRDLEHYLYYNQKPITTESHALYYIIALLCVFVIIYLMLFNAKPHLSDCKCNSCTKPVVNHFHVSGGYSNAVTDNSMSNYESYRTPDMSLAFIKTEAKEPPNDVKSS